MARSSIRQQRNHLNLMFVELELRTRGRTPRNMISAYTSVESVGTCMHIDIARPSRNGSMKW